jgi:hypothetical protein
MIFLAPPPIFYLHQASNGRIGESQVIYFLAVIGCSTKFVFENDWYKTPGSPGMIHVRKLIAVNTVFAFK